MENEFRPLSPDDTFRFSCNRTVACFNACCRDLNQFLTPYDILRLKTGLALTATEFLGQYTTRHTGPETGLPIIALKPLTASGLACPFVTPSGCSVYEHRPSSCRIYPIARAISRSRETGLIGEHCALLKEPHCLGHQQKKTQTVREWVSDQELDIYNEFNDMLMEIIALKNRRGSDPLDIKLQLQFHTALYDLDRFRIQVFDKGLLDDFNLEAGLLNRARKDDPALLRIGHAWVKQTMYR
ncbi:MAG: YkgJ family cysteine cluster protein [Deltaproteobacteria bacterium]|nr:YkgJ family cysteine cluster protein [Deltaproteobacteria bacterium]